MSMLEILSCLTPAQVQVLVEDPCMYDVMCISSGVYEYKTPSNLDLDGGLFALKTIRVFPSYTSGGVLFLTYEPIKSILKPCDGEEV